MLLAAVQATLIAGITLVTVALPAVQRALGATRSDLALVTVAYGLSFGGLLMLGGRLADLAGRRRVFSAGVAVFAFGSAAGALAPGVATLVAARFVQGVGAALVAPAALALLGAVFPDPAQRSRMSALWGGVNGAGATIGMLLSGVVVTLGSWRWVFGVPVLVGLAALVLAPRLLPAPPRRRVRIDVPGAVFVTVGVSAVSFGFLRVPEAAWSHPQVWLTILMGGAVLVALFARQRHVPDPLLPTAFLADRRRATGVAAIFLMAGGMSTTVFLLSLFFQQEVDYPPLLTSAAFVPYAAAQLGAVASTGRLVARFGTRVVVVVGATLVGVGLASLSGMDADSAYWGLPLAGLLAFGVGAALTFGGAMTAAITDVPDEHAGVVGGVVNTAMETGPTVGFAVLVALGTFAFPVAAVIFAVSAAVALFTLKEERHDDRSTL